MLDINNMWVQVIPNMTSNTSPSGTCSASSYFYLTPPWNAFTVNNANAWISDGTSSGWVQYQFDFPIAISKYSINGWCVDQWETRRPYSWTFKGSIDGTNFDTLDTQTAYTSWLVSKHSYFTTTNTKRYTHYRLDISANSGNAYLAVGSLSMYAYVKEILLSSNKLRSLSNISGRKFVIG